MRIFPGNPTKGAVSPLMRLFPVFLVLIYSPAFSSPPVPLRRRNPCPPLPVLRPALAAFPAEPTSMIPFPWQYALIWRTRTAMFPLSVTTAP
jgi:hypothetical protein